MAATLVERYSLLPPIDVDAVAKRFADVEVNAIPGRCDGLVVGLHGPRSRPLILVEQRQPHTRRRFTMAHELGHVLIPWHVASDMVCDTAKSPWYLVEPHEAAARANEVEANEFAAELLTPSGWLAHLIGSRGPDPGALTREVLSIGVSAQAACIRLSKVLPSGRVWAIVDAGGQIFSKRTDPRDSYRPTPGGKSARPRPARPVFYARRRGSSRSGTRRLVDVSRISVRRTAHAGLSGRSSSEIEALLLERHAGPDADRIRRSLSGVIGSAFVWRSATVTRQRQPSRPGFVGRFAKERQKIPASMIDDPDFSEWLARRALDLASRATSPRQ